MADRTPRPSGPAAADGGSDDAADDATERTVVQSKPPRARAAADARATLPAGRAPAVELPSAEEDGALSDDDGEGAAHLADAGPETDPDSDPPAEPPWAERAASAPVDPPRSSPAPAAKVHQDSRAAAAAQAMRARAPEDPFPQAPGPAPKSSHYFRGGFAHPNVLPLGDELARPVAARLLLIGSIFASLGIGLLLGYLLAPGTPKATLNRIAELEEALIKQQAQAATLTQQLSTSVGKGGGKLKKSDRLRHEREGKRYAKSLKHTGAQAAGNLIEWFVRRWNELLDAPLPDDRATRRAATLALLVGGMAANLNPGDYVPWQAEFLSGNWLGELHFDMDHDGLPGKRSDLNQHDGFANVSVCQVAMALNQSMRDAQVLVMPELRCDRPEARMSVFLQGKTFDDALDEFVAAVKAHGFLVVEKREAQGMRLVLLGVRPKATDDDE